MAQSKSHPSLRVSSGHDDQTIRDLITWAREKVEHDADIALVTQTWQQIMSGFGGAEIPLRKPPLASVSSVSYVDTAGATQTLSTAYYAVDSYRKPGVVRLKPDYSWPATDDVYNAVTIQFVAGAAVASVPTAAKQAMHVLIGARYANRGMDVAEERLYRSLIGQIGYGRYP